MVSERILWDASEKSDHSRSGNGSSLLPELTNLVYRNSGNTVGNTRSY